MKRRQWLFFRTPTYKESSDSVRNLDDLAFNKGFSTDARPERNADSGVRFV